MCGLPGSASVLLYLKRILTVESLHVSFSQSARSSDICGACCRKWATYTKTILPVRTALECDDAHFQLLGIKSPKMIFCIGYIFVFAPHFEVRTSRGNAHLADQLLSRPFGFFFSSINKSARVDKYATIEGTANRDDRALCAETRNYIWPTFYRMCDLTVCGGTRCPQGFFFFLITNSCPLESVQQKQTSDWLFFGFLPRPLSLSIYKEREKSRFWAQQLWFRSVIYCLVQTVTWSCTALAKHLL